jgi:hypothetical protein
VTVSRRGSGWSCERPRRSLQASKLRASGKIHSKRCRYLPKVCSQFQDPSFSRFPIVPWSYMIIVHSFIFLSSFYSFPNLLCTLFCAGYGLLPLPRLYAIGFWRKSLMFFQCFSHHWCGTFRKNMLLFSMHVRFCTFIPFLVFLEHFISFFLIPQIHSNSIVLTQSLYLLGDSIHIPNVCASAAIATPDTVLCCYIRQHLLYQQHDHSRFRSHYAFTVSRQRLGAHCGST